MTSPFLSSVIITLQIFGVIISFSEKISYFYLTDCSLQGRFSGLHKLQILDFIFNDPTILGDLHKYHFQLDGRGGKGWNLFFAPDDLDFFYKSDNARKMLFYFQVSNNNRDQKSEDEAAIDNSVNSWILISINAYLSTYLSLPAWGDGWGPRSPREPQEVETFREERGGDASQVQGTSTSASQVQGGWEHIHILRWSDQEPTFDLTKKQPVICDLFDQDLVNWPRTALQPNTFKSSKKKLFITDGTDATLTGYCMYFLRWFKTSFFGDEWFCWMKIISIKSTAKARPSKYWIFNRQDADHFMLWFNDIDLQSRTQTKRTLGEETFQREIMGGLINGITLSKYRSNEENWVVCLLWKYVQNEERLLSVKMCKKFVFFNL